MLMRRFSAVALCLLAALAGGYVGEYAHTDDGCAFETHCLACQRQVGSLAVVAPPLTASVAFEAVGSAAPPARVALLPAPIRAEAPRGPPLV